MPPQLLPASAAAFAPRASSVNVVLGSKVEPWLTQTLKRINRVKRPLNSVQQHQRCLTETLSSSNAIWTLTSMMLPKAPESDLRRDANPLMEAIFNWQLLHIEAYIVHVDMVLRNEVAYKLTPDSIETLIEYHKDIYCVDAKADSYDWPEKEQHAKKLHEDFIQAINRFVYRTHVSALEGLEEEGAGELLCGKSEEVKNNIMGLLNKPLLPPPPKIVDVIRQPPLLPSSPAGAGIWSHSTPSPALPAPVDSWRVLPSSPATSADSGTPIWASMALHELPSPTPSYSQPYSTAGFFYSSPMVASPIPALPLPSMLAPHCGINVGYGGFGWDRYQEYATTM
ncbi:Uu.00g002830.m01.CDS01 [Anthostomella pinea]|uniref:Uu.00g002830.m01.CDS01 n=1 Tax=Anthostomella pinea TaxID=933095 RepID=A0AAI8YIS6_9PEZI|nr:Uu.00g002830.m01.CDS01 [Anthostomella pinea]